jgi:glyoxylase-like metal-dependent hydrolase (beta-lactamase superfamily II)
MRTHHVRMPFVLAAALALTLAIPGVPAAQAVLRTQVFTSTAEGYSTTSTLVSGEKDAILVDPQFLLSEAHKVAAMVLESKKNLTTVYTTHGHPDHYFGGTVMKQAFPSARWVALPAVLMGVQNGWKGRYTFWTATHGANVPAPGTVMPEALDGTTLTLEGQELRIVGGVMGDGPNNSFVWIPSTRTVLGGDIVFSGVHFGVPAQPGRAEWLKTLDQIAALKPAVVVPGHQLAGSPNDVSALAFMKKYMQDWDAAVAGSKSADELVGRMKKIYPSLGMEQLLTGGAQAAFRPAPAK